jgi:transcriptional regulator with PAS, ATPase and Fis domain
MVALGKFRQDLYYRINVMQIDIPPLQEHPEDIPLIARHFLRHYSEINGKVIDEIDPAAMCLLQGYSWPGNARELENVIQRAIIVARDSVIRAEDLPPNIQEDSVVNIDDYRPTGSFDRQLRDYKIKLAATAVRDNQGNKTLAARSLQISRAYLHRLIRLAEDGTISEREGQEMGAV